ncbi:hypothetical protein [Roseateles sp.]|uniref:hypothetical protein n=1 Tax=Roseateles sp. TaxID=1971397 RepID=UPI0032640BF0
MSRWTAALFACLLGAVAACPAVHAADAASPVIARFESGAAADGKRLVLACAKSAPGAAVACGLGQLAATAAAPGLSMQFQLLPPDRAYLLSLVRNAVEAQVRDPRVVEGISLIPADAMALQQVAKNPAVCVGDENTADVMLACPTGKRFEDAVVMLFRGLCDRCEFQPIVVRKVN